VISDEQMLVSDGMVRCGTCRERFQAKILGTEGEAPRFDPREAFIEPLTDELEEQKRAAEQALSDTEPQKISFADPHTETEKIVLLSEATVSESINSELSLDIDEDGPITPVDSRELTAITMLANIRAKHERELEQKAIANEALQNQRDTEVASQEPAEDKTSDKETLIDTVDSLVVDKLLSTQPKEASQDSPGQTSFNATIASESKQKSEKPKANRLKDNQNDSYADEPFTLDSQRKAKSRSWLYAPPLLVFIAVLAAVLVYQLWIKQILLFTGTSVAERKIAELSVPLVKKLAENNIVLPVRRNLSKLELVSARTEGHPTRPSTVLLRISVINHAEITQPLPWLEMTLTDAEGRLISRRNLSPNDYVYQNRTSDAIGARELKKVTIELLSFPKHASGYEVKILDK
jgi:hypothetical protein